jgi:hypothetical protein
MPTIICACGHRFVARGGEAGQETSCPNCRRSHPVPHPQHAWRRRGADEQEHRTTGCSELGHPEFSFACAPGVPPVWTEWLARLLEEKVRDGERFEDGEDMQVGFMLVLFKQHEDGSLRVLEPDMESLPTVFIDSVTRTLTTCMLQKYVVESCMDGSRLSPPTLRDSAIVCNRFAGARHLSLVRSAPKGKDSGWFIGCQDESHDHNAISNLVELSLYELALRRPDLVQYLGLPREAMVLVGQAPKGWIFRRGDERIRVLLGPEELPILEGSYLEAVNSKR